MKEQFYIFAANCLQKLRTKSHSYASFVRFLLTVADDGDSAQEAHFDRLLLCTDLTSSRDKILR